MTIPNREQTLEQRLTGARGGRLMGGQLTVFTEASYEINSEVPRFDFGHGVDHSVSS